MGRASRRKKSNGQGVVKRTTAGQRTRKMLRLPVLEEMVRKVPDVQRVQMDDCVVTVGTDQGRWHLQLEHPTRLPSWDEVADARDLFHPPVRPGMVVHVAVVLPPKGTPIEEGVHLWAVGESPT